MDLLNNLTLTKAYAFNGIIIDAPSGQMEAFLSSKPKPHRNKPPERWASLDAIGITGSTNGDANGRVAVAKRVTGGGWSINVLAAGIVLCCLGAVFLSMQVGSFLTSCHDIKQPFVRSISVCTTSFSSPTCAMSIMLRLSSICLQLQTKSGLAEDCMRTADAFQYEVNANLFACHVFKTCYRQ